MTNYDIIGDVHGKGAKLTGLLEVLGWRPDGDGVYRHAEPDRQVIFVGDLVDRGEDQRQVLTIARAMVEAGTARMIMGNHEFNAICFATRDPKRWWGFLRRHTMKNRHQCSAFVKQIPKRERADWVAWFRTLPLWLDEEELGGLRVVHACWHEESMRVVREACSGNVLGDDVALYARASDPADRLYKAIEVLLKGPEVRLADYDLPPFRDPSHPKHHRHHARLRWWSNETKLVEVIDIREETLTASGEKYPHIPEKHLKPEHTIYTYEDRVPLVFGHHWRNWEPNQGEDWTEYTACVDFSAGKDGPLVAYRWRNGNTTIDPAGFTRSLEPSGNFPAD